MAVSNFLFQRTEKMYLALCHM